MTAFELRQHVRYKMKDGLLAALPVPGKLKIIVGQIINISENGLALRHKDQIATPIDRAELLLMGHERPDGSVLEIPARLIYEKDVGEAYRSGFQFGDLSQGQTSQLASFIQSNVE